jgi:thioredoxin-like negative regulator of GroEL
LAAVYSNQVAFVRVDLSAADAAPIEAQYIVKAVPTFVFLMNGRETHRLVGSTARDRLTFMIERKLLHP